MERITGPLNMSMTYPNEDTSRGQFVLTSRAKPYRLDEEGNLVFTRYPEGLKASAGMVSTVLDMAKFDTAMDRNLLVLEESKEVMFTPAISNSGEQLPYGLGWFVQELEDSKLVWHSGWQPDAYSALFLKVPQKDLTLILLANSDGASASFNLSEGNVLTSPFAVTFLRLFAHMKVLSSP